MIRPDRTMTMGAETEIRCKYTEKKKKTLVITRNKRAEAILTIAEAREARHEKMR